MASEGFLQGRNGSRRFCEKRHELFLSLARKANDFDFGDGLLRRFLRGGDNEVAHGAPLDFCCPPNNGKHFGRNARLQSCGSVWVLLRHETSYN